MFVQPPVPVAETWIWKAFAYAASQVRTTWQICCVEPRSTCNHCGSLKALDQRVPVLPSTAAEAGEPAFSTVELVAGRFNAALAVPPPPPVGSNEPDTWKWNN